MIIAFFRLIVVGFVVMTAFYFLISVYSRSLRREKLEKRWAAEGGIGDRDAYVEEGLKRYDASIRPKLVLLVYIVPTLVIAVLFYLINFT
jgi:hypothetical protein